MAAIEVEKLTKAYGSHQALRGITFQVERGQVLGFLGPNGAGKTTTMRILTGSMGPTSGTARIEGFDVVTDSLEVRRRLGYLPESAPLYLDMTAREYLGFIADVRGIEPSRRAAAIDGAARDCDIRDVLGRPIGQLSKGYRQRVGLAQALLHAPEILILDEPTSGLDPNQIVEIREVIRRIGREKTVVLSSHILSEVQATCDRVLIVHQGQIAADGTAAELARHAEGRARISITVRAPVGLGREALAAKLRAAVPGILEVEAGDDEADAFGFHLTTDQDRDSRGDLFRFAVETGLVLLEMRRELRSLEDVFRQLTGQAAA